MSFTLLFLTHAKLLNNDAMRSRTVGPGSSGSEPVRQESHVDQLQACLVVSPDSGRGPPKAKSFPANIDLSKYFIARGKWSSTLVQLKE